MQSLLRLSPYKEHHANAKRRATTSWFADESGRWLRPGPRWRRRHGPPDPPSRTDQYLDVVEVSPTPCHQPELQDVAEGATRMTLRNSRRFRSMMILPDRLIRDCRITTTQSPLPTLVPREGGCLWATSENDESGTAPGTNLRRLTDTRVRAIRFHIIEWVETRPASRNPRASDLKAPFLNGHMEHNRHRRRAPSDTHRRPSPYELPLHDYGCQVEVSPAYVIDSSFSSTISESDTVTTEGS